MTFGASVMIIYIDREGRFATTSCAPTYLRKHDISRSRIGTSADVESGSFEDYYSRFIGHFASVYERFSPLFARLDSQWSLSAQNIEQYNADLEKGRVPMGDIMGLQTPHTAAAAAGKSVWDLDDDWPYM